MLVPVISIDGKPLMPTKPSKARLLIKERKATPFFKKGIFCIRLNFSTTEYIQDIIFGLDPGSKRTGISICTEKYSILHIQANTPDWVKGHVEQRRMMRSARRARNTPYRKCRSNRTNNGIPPSTKARWDAHLRIMKQLLKIIPISIVSFEDIQAKTKTGQKKWNKSFSPLEVGKKYFYNYVEKVLKLKLYLFQGYDTYNHRKLYGYKKIANKLSDKFEAHCVDSFSLCEMVDGGQLELSSKKIYHLTFLEFHRRQLHVLVPAKNGVRKTYGGTRSLGLTRGTLVKHKKYGLSYVGGSMKGKISLHNITHKRRLSQSIKTEDCKILTNQSYVINLK